MEPFPEKLGLDIDTIFSAITIETIKQQLEKDPGAIPILKEKIRADYARFCRTQAGRELADYILAL